MAIISKNNGIIKGTGNPNLDVNIQDGDNPTPIQYIDVSTIPYTQYLFDSTLISGSKWVEIQSVPSYKVYSALLTQSGTNDPVATVLENTLGGTVVWTRESLGKYVGTLLNAFPTNKTTVNDSSGNSGGDYYSVSWYDYSGGITTGIHILDQDRIEVVNFNSPASDMDFTDGIIDNRVAINIKVYP